VYRGSFNLPVVSDREAITLLLQAVGATQSISLNGHELAANRPYDAKGYNYVVDHALLKVGRNVITIYATPAGKDQELRFHWDQGGPAVVQIIRPAPQWQRHVFNGLAQVIVQSEEHGGEIRLTATSTELAPAEITLQSQ
jgi:hypothetical protein